MTVVTFQCFWIILVFRVPLSLKICWKKDTGKVFSELTSPLTEGSFAWFAPSHSCSGLHSAHTWLDELLFWRSHRSISPSPITFHFVQSSSRSICHQKYSLYIYGVLLSCLAKFEPVCPCYNIEGSIFITRVSVALNNGWRSRNNIFKHFICLSAFITPALYCAPYYLIVVGFYKVNIIQSIGKCFVWLITVCDYSNSVGPVRIRLVPFVHSQS